MMSVALTNHLNNSQLLQERKPGFFFLGPEPWPVISLGDTGSVLSLEGDNGPKVGISEKA